MCIMTHASFLPHSDPDAFLAFDRDTLGLELRNDVGSGKMRWITAGPADQPGTSIVELTGHSDSDHERANLSPEVKRLELVRRTEVLRNG